MEVDNTEPEEFRPPVLTSEYSDRQNFAVSEDTNNKRDREIDKERKNESETERNNEHFYEIVVLIFLQF